jgi:hypothetical protein
LRGFDAAEWLEDPAHLALTDGRNIAMFEKQSEDTWVGHNLFEDRGRDAIAAGFKFLSEMFVTYGAKCIVGETPVRKIAARWFNRQLGFQSKGIRPTPHGNVELFVMER